MSRRDGHPRKRKPAAGHGAHGPETQEFHREFEAHTDQILRRRLLWFIVIWGGLSVLLSIPSWVMAADQAFELGIFAEEVAEALNSRLKI